MDQQLCTAVAEDPYLDSSQLPMTGFWPLQALHPQPDTHTCTHLIKIKDSKRRFLSLQIT